jgi:hypothetical protein
MSSGPAVTDSPRVSPKPCRTVWLSAEVRYRVFSQTFEVRMPSDGSKIDAAQDLLNLTRMNWNTVDIRGNV